MSVRTPDEPNVLDPGMRGATDLTSGEGALGDKLLMADGESGGAA